MRRWRHGNWVSKLPLRCGGDDAGKKIEKKKKLRMTSAVDAGCVNSCLVD